MATAEDIIELLGLEPLPGEGGFYRETYRAAETLAAKALPERYSTPRPCSTAIYYLVTPESFSALHRLPTDEIFHHYGGDPVQQLHLHPDGSGKVVVLGMDLAGGQRPQVLVPARVWQGARLVPGAGQGWALLGTTMAPGFDFADFDAGSRRRLAVSYPQFRDLVEALTPAP
jgi:predicted cupin superfamily sugar epimerase